jgi:hypothetical protein
MARAVTVAHVAMTRATAIGLLRADRRVRRQGMMAFPTCLGAHHRAGKLDPA